MELGNGPELPAVGTVQGDTQGAAVSPHQGAQESIAQRQGFVPYFGGLSVVEAVLRKWELDRNLRIRLAAATAAQQGKQYSDRGQPHEFRIIS